MDFKNKDVEQDYLQTVERIKSLIDSPVDNKKYLWDTTVDLYAKKN